MQCTGKPYNVVEKNDNHEIRLFKYNEENARQLFWHKDKEDRIATVLSGNMTFQFDNELPIILKGNEQLFIPKESYHRIILKEDFIIKITRI